MFCTRFIVRGSGFIVSLCNKHFATSDFDIGDRQDAVGSVPCWHISGDMSEPMNDDGAERRPDSSILANSYTDCSRDPQE